MRKSKVIVNPDFKDFVKLGQPFPVEEAVNVISKFHHTTPKYVRHAFRDLDKAEHHVGYTAIFNKSKKDGVSCIKVQCFDNEGKWVCTSFIDKHTGQPIHEHN